MKVFFIISLISLNIFFVSCSDYKTVTVAVIYPSRSEIAYYSRNGITLFLNDFKNIFKSYKLNLIQKPVELRPDAIKNSFIEIEKEYKPLFYIVFTSFIAVSIKDIAKEFNAPVFALASEPSLTESTDFMFRYFFSVDEQALLYHRVIQQKGFKKITIFYQNEPYSISVKDKLLDYLKRDNIKVKTYSFSIELYKNRDEIKDISFDNDCLVILGYKDNISSFLSILKERKYKGTLLLTLSFDKLDSVYDGVEVFVPVSKFNDPTNAISNKLKTEYKTLFDKDIESFSALFYDSLRLLFSFIHNNNFFSRKDILKFYEKEFTYIGVFGIINKEKNKKDVFIPLKMGKIVDRKIIIDDK